MDAADFVERYAGWLFAAAIAVISWFGQRNLKQYDDAIADNARRIREMERTVITRAELKEVVKDFLDERRGMHAENKQVLTNILETINQNERADSKTRHDIRDEVQVLTAQVAVIAQSQGIDLPQRRPRRE